MDASKLFSGNVVTLINSEVNNGQPKEYKITEPVIENNEIIGGDGYFVKPEDSTVKVYEIHNSEITFIDKATEVFFGSLDEFRKGLEEEKKTIQSLRDEFKEIADNYVNHLSNKLEN